MAHHYVSSSPKGRALRQREDILGVIEATAYRTSASIFTITAHNFGQSYDDLYANELEQHLASLQKAGLCRISSSESYNRPWDVIYTFSSVNTKKLNELKRQTEREIRKLAKDQSQYEEPLIKVWGGIRTTCKVAYETLNTIHKIIILIVGVTGLTIATFWHFIWQSLQKL